MMASKIRLLIVLWLPAAFQAGAQPSNIPRLQVVQKQMANAYMQHDTAALLRIYAINAVSMPEYHPGTFSNKFTLRKKATDYEGKYIDIWRIKSDGGLQLLSEITGSTKNIDRSDLPLSAFQILDTVILPKPTVNATSLAIQSLNDQVAALDAWYRQHESPNNNISAVHIGATRLIDAGTYVLEDANYKVDHPGGDPGTSVTGKNITVWKRDHSGHLLVFRQMTVND
jgi:hypothetical protein